MGIQLAEDDVLTLDSVPGLPVASSQALNLSNQTISDLLMDINAVAETIPEGQDGAIVGSLTREGWFAAVIVKAPHGWNVKGFVSQEHGEKLDYGIGVVKTFKF